MYPVQYLTLKNGETIAYRDTNTEGKTLLLVHGNMSSSVHYEILMERLQNYYHVIAVDMRGFGDSSYLQEINSLHDFAVDIEELILTLDLKDVSLLGWSTGGGVVLEIAVDLPDRIEKVFLLDSVGIKGFSIYRKDTAGQPIMEELLSTKEDIAIDPIQVLPILDAYKTKNKPFLRMVWDASIYNLKKPNAALYDSYLDAMLKQRNLVDVDYSLVHFNMSDESNGVEEGNGRIHKVECPVVILHGTKDLVVPFSDSEYTASVLGDKAKLIPLKGVGHSVISDDLDLISEVIINNM